MWITTFNKKIKALDAILKKFLQRIKPQKVKIKSRPVEKTTTFLLKKIKWTKIILIKKQIILMMIKTTMTTIYKSLTK